MLGYLNINSIRNKFENLKSLIENKIDIFTVAETKIDNSFPTCQFLIDGFSKPYRRDDTSKSGGLLTYVSENIPSQLKSDYATPADMQIIPVEVNLRKVKWLIVSIYRPPSQDCKYFLENLSLLIDFYSGNYDNIIIIGDFNIEPHVLKMSTFLEKHDLYNHISEKTCWKAVNGTCIDLLLSNKKFSLKHSGTALTGLSDWHSLIYSMLKVTYTKLEPKKVIYRNFKNFNKELFVKDLNGLLQDNIENFSDFQRAFIDALNRHAPQKTRFLRGNNKPHMSKELRKAIMKRSKLQRIAFNSRNTLDWERYKLQRNRVVSLNRKAKRIHFANVSVKTNSKNFWNACKPFFSDKDFLTSKTVLVEDGEVISKNEIIATSFNQYFCNITASLPIKQWTDKSTMLGKFDIVSIAIEKFKDHPSVVNIKSLQSQNDDVTFEFCHTSSKEISDTILKLDTSKSTSGNIPTKILKDVAHEVAESLSSCFNTSLDLDSFPNELKLSDIVPVHKKGSTTDKSNYRPISLLPTLSKVYERIIFNQLLKIMETKLSKYLCGFRKGYSTQHCLLNLLQAWQKHLSNSGKVGAVLMDLSKAFDVLPYDLLIAKLWAYGIGTKSLRFLYSYLNDRKMRVRVESAFSEWLNVLLGVPQGSILGPLLFNIFVNDLFLCDLVSFIANYADDNTLYVMGHSLHDVMSTLTNEVPIVVDWFRINQMVVNPDKFQFLLLGCQKDEECTLAVDNNTITSTDYVKLLGVDIDNKLNFSNHISDLCAKANRKINALLRIRSKLNLEQASTLCDAYILSSFRYCPLIWMFCSKSDDKKINSTHVRALRTVHRDFTTPRDKVLDTYNVETIHRENLRLLATEVFKSIHRLNPSFMWDFFTDKTLSQNLRRGHLLKLPRRSECKQNSLVFRAVLLWNNLPAEVKGAASLSEFKSSIKKQRALYCQCRLCKNT